MINEEVFKTLVQIFKIKTPDSKIFIEKIDESNKSLIVLKINEIVYKCVHVDSKTYYKNYNFTEFTFEAENPMYPTYLFKVNHMNKDSSVVFCNVLIHASNNYDIEYGWDAFDNYFKNDNVAFALINVSKSLMYRFTSDNEVTRLMNRLEKRGWNTELYEDGLELQKYSPAGQDFVIQLEGETFDELVESAKKFNESYDPSKEAMRWIDDKGHGINGAPHDLIDLVQDLIWCKQETKKLSDYLILFQSQLKKASN